MIFKLGRNIKEGQKIKTRNGWRKVRVVYWKGVIIKEGLIKFGETIYGWRSN